MGFNPEQVQDFYPTPSTISTCMYYTGLDPLTMEEAYVPRTPHEKALQRALIQYRNPANYDLVREALVKAGRSDLIGWDEKALIRPKRPKATGRAAMESVLARARSAISAAAPPPPRAPRARPNPSVPASPRRPTAARAVSARVGEVGRTRLPL